MPPILTTLNTFFITRTTKFPAPHMQNKTLCIIDSSTLLSKFYKNDTVLQNVRFLDTEILTVTLPTGKSARRW